MSWECLRSKLTVFVTCAPFSGLGPPACSLIPDNATALFPLWIPGYCSFIVRLTANREQSAWRGLRIVKFTYLQVDWTWVYISRKYLIVGRKDKKKKKSWIPSIKNPSYTAITITPRAKNLTRLFHLACQKSTDVFLFPVQPFVSEILFQLKRKIMKR